MLLIIYFSSFFRLEWQKQKDRVKIQERHSKHKQRITFQNITRGNLKKHRYSNIDNSRLKRSVSKARYVEALLVADSTMVEFHEQGDVETYLLSIMNMVSLFLFYLAETTIKVSQIFLTFQPA